MHSISPSLSSKSTQACSRAFCERFCRVESSSLPRAHQFVRVIGNVQPAIQRFRILAFRSEIERAQEFAARSGAHWKSGLDRDQSFPGSRSARRSGKCHARLR